MLIAFKEEEEKLAVRVVSENSKEIISHSPKELFALNSLLDILSEEQADNLLDHLDFIRDEAATDVSSNGPEVFMLSIRPPNRRTLKLWCAPHINDVSRDLVICEFEIEDDTVNPLVPAEELAESAIAESAIAASKPLRILRNARKKKGEAAAMEVFIMTQVQEQLSSAATLQSFLRVPIGVVKELIGFHCVIVYQFDHAWNGQVVAELVDQRATKDIYKGLNFPASDIPKQARDLYKLNKVRLLYDRDQETARLVCRTVEDLETPLDLTYSLGLGLAVIARTIQNMNGQLCLKTEEGKGSHFVIQVGFKIASHPLLLEYRDKIDAPSSAPRSSPTTPSHVEDEVILVNQSASKKKEHSGFVRRESKETHSAICLSRSARLNSRIPIFAVSASLVENERHKYMETGFDGWILKPVDFERIGLLLKGLIDAEARKECLYQPGKWERGSWFEDPPFVPDVHAINTKPSGEPPTILPPPISFPRGDTV